MKFKFIFCFVLIYLTCSVTIGYKCGVRSSIKSEKVSDRNEIDPGSWPWIAALVHLRLNSYFCGASVISEKHLLSGKH
jgi:secreted trypsin-like serine protease